MVVRKSTKLELNQPKPETIEESKDRLLSKLRSYSIDVITLAVMYATNFEAVGEDVTTKWITTEQQTRALQTAYNKGFTDALNRTKEDKKKN